LAGDYGLRGRPAAIAVAAASVRGRLSLGILVLLVEDDSLKLFRQSPQFRHVGSVFDTFQTKVQPLLRGLERRSVWSCGALGRDFGARPTSRNRTSGAGATLLGRHSGGPIQVTLANGSTVTTNTAFQILP